MEINKKEKAFRDMERAPTGQPLSGRSLHPWVLTPSPETNASVKSLSPFLCV